MSQQPRFVRLRASLAVSHATLKHDHKNQDSTNLVICMLTLISSFVVAKLPGVIISRRIVG